MDIFRVIEELKNAWNRIREGSMEEQRRFRKGVAALSKALNETRIRLGRNQVTREDEEELSRLWADAGFAISQFDHELALRCDIKASYWANPERWTDEEIEEAKIEIGSIEKEIRGYLKGKPKAKKKSKC